MTPDELVERAQWDTFWVPPDVTVVDRPELLYLSCPRDRRYLNMVTRTRCEDAALPALIDEVQAAHRGRRSRWLVPPTIPTEPLEAALAAAAYSPGERYRVCAADVSDFRPRAAAEPLDVRRVEDASMLDDAYAVADAVFGDVTPADEGQRQRELAACTGPDARVARFVAYDRERKPVSVGALTLFPALHFGLLWGGSTLANARHRGCYSALLGARIAWAEAAGLRRVGLLAKVNSSAPIVLARGFSAHGIGCFWDRPA